MRFGNSTTSSSTKKHSHHVMMASDMMASVMMAGDMRTGVLTKHLLLGRRLCRRWALIFVVVMGLALNAGWRVAMAESPPQPETASIKVVTSFTILADMTRQVAGDHAQVVSITRVGAEIHGYQPTPQDLVQAIDADLLLYNGLNLEQWMEQFLDNLGDIPSVALSDGITPLPIRTGRYEGKANPHAWMGLSNAKVYIDNIAVALSQADPQHQQHYLTNAEAYKNLLTKNIAPLKTRIDALPASYRWLVTCEGAFSYLAADLGMKELYLWPINAHQQATPKQVRKVIDTVREHQIPVVFCESTVNTAPAEQVARETGVEYGGVLYVDSLSKADGPVPSYLDLMTVNVTLIADSMADALSKRDENEK
jgi:manganese/iron transport system substrate-binding protein